MSVRATTTLVRLASNEENNRVPALKRGTRINPRVPVNPRAVNSLAARLNEQSAPFDPAKQQILIDNASARLLQRRSAGETGDLYEQAKGEGIAKLVVLRTDGKLDKIDYSALQAKNGGEATKVDQAIQQLRSQQAANPGSEVSTTIKVGKRTKFTISLNSDGSIKQIKRKKKKRGFLGGLLKGIGNVFKKLLPVLSVVSMFVPFAAPLALGLKIANAVSGAVNAIKSKNILGAIGSVAGAFTGGFNNAVSKLAGTISKVANTANAVLNVAKNGIKSIWDGISAISGVASNLGNKTFAAISGAIGSGIAAVKNFKSGNFLDGFISLGNGIGGINQNAGRIQSEREQKSVKAREFEVGGIRYSFANNITLKPFNLKQISSDTRVFFDSIFNKTARFNTPDNKPQSLPAVKYAGYIAGNGGTSLSDYAQLDNGFTPGRKVQNMTFGDKKFDGYYVGRRSLAPGDVRHTDEGFGTGFVWQLRPHGLVASDESYRKSLTTNTVKNIGDRLYSVEGRILGFKDGTYDVEYRYTLIDRPRIDSIIQDSKNQRTGKVSNGGEAYKFPHPQLANDYLERLQENALRTEHRAVWELKPVAYDMKGLNLPAGFSNNRPIYQGIGSPNIASGVTITASHTLHEIWLNGRQVGSLNAHQQGVGLYKSVTDWNGDSNRRLYQSIPVNLSTIQNLSDSLYQNFRNTGFGDPWICQDISGFVESRLGRNPNGLMSHAYNARDDYGNRVNLNGVTTDVYRTIGRNLLPKLGSTPVSSLDPILLRQERQRQILELFYRK